MSDRYNDHVISCIMYLIDQSYSYILYIDYYIFFIHIFILFILYYLRNKTFDILYNLFISKGNIFIFTFH